MSRETVFRVGMVVAGRPAFISILNSRSSTMWRERLLSTHHFAMWALKLSQRKKKPLVEVKRTVFHLIHMHGMRQSPLPGLDERKLRRWIHLELQCVHYQRQPQQHHAQSTELRGSSDLRLLIGLLSPDTAVRHHPLHLLEAHRKK
jgi:hypothetical protein